MIVKKGWKISLWTAGAVLAVLVLLGVYGKYSPAINAKLDRMYAEKVQRAYEREQKEYEAILKADKAGGQTPEETLEMFVSALKQNDVELASSYYEYGVRKQARQSLADELQKDGILEKSYLYFNRLFQEGEKMCRDSVTCVFEYVYFTDKDDYITIHGIENTLVFVPQGSRERNLVALSLNTPSGTWKITQPY